MDQQRLNMSSSHGVCWSDSANLRASSALSYICAATPLQPETSISVFFPATFEMAKFTMASAALVIVALPASVITGNIGTSGVTMSTKNCWNFV